MNRYLRTAIVMVALVTLLSSFAGFINSSVPPQGYTGADGFYCNNCHSDNPLNNAGGNISVTGLPIDSYTAGTAYNFSTTTTHSAADRLRWGFSISARNAANQVVGSFSSSNANAALNANELSHLNAVATQAQQSYTYDNLTWTAPANPGMADTLITFYYVGNAANGSGRGGDFIYKSSQVAKLSVSYTFTGNGNWDNAANWANGAVPPATVSGSTSIIIDPPSTGECVLNVVQHIGNATNLTVKAGKKFRIAGDLIINN